jgi:imidazolonepropionase-like amidohydrolase
MQPIVFRNAKLIDVDRQEPEITTIRIEGERIAAIGQQAEEGADARVIDLGGRSVMSGMFSCHFHASYSPMAMMTGMPLGMDSPATYQAIVATGNLRRALECGFTGAVGAGTPHAIDTSLKRAVDEGLIPGPRLMAGSRDVSTTAHASEKFFPWHWETENPAAVSCDGADAMRGGVRGEIKRGAEIIKVFATAGHGVPGMVDKVDLTQDEMNAAADAAHQRGAKIRAHIANRAGILSALEAGFDVIDHGDGLDETCIAKMVEAGTFFCPSMRYPHEYVSRYQDVLADSMKEGFEGMMGMLPLANEAGVKIVLGDDYGSPDLAHGSYGEELAFHADVVGIPARDVLRWATVNGAELMDRGHELGAVKPGYLADLIVVDGDPMSNIALLSDPGRILAVMKDGCFFKDELKELSAGEDSVSAFGSELREGAAVQ